MTSTQPGETGTPHPPVGPWPAPTGAPSAYIGDPAWAPPAGPASAPAPLPVVDPRARARRRRLRVAFVAVPALLLTAGAASVVTLAVAGHDHDTATAAASAPAASSSQRASALAARATLGTITAQTPTSWTVRTAQGTTATVDLGSSTHYGSSKHPETLASFHQGSTVAVLGHRSGSTIDATHVLAVKAAAVSRAESAAGTTGGNSSTT